MKKTVFITFVAGLVVLFLIFSHSNSYTNNKKDTRIVTVGIIAEKSLNETDANWQKKFYEAMTRTSDIYLKNFGIQFKINGLIIEEEDFNWATGYNKDNPAIDSSDIIIFLHSRAGYWYGGSFASGLAFYEKSFVWLFLGSKTKDYFNEPTAFAWLISHEIGHIFKADHSKTITIMNPYTCYENSCLTFDEINKKIILDDKNREFKR